MVISKRRASAPPWLLLVFSLPRKGASLRVAVWRKLQSYGCLPLGNSGYLLPNNTGNREKFEWLATTIRGGHGEASVVEVQAIDNHDMRQLVRQFTEARTEDYRELLSSAKEHSFDSKNSARQLSRLRQRLQEVVSIDFFGSPLREQVEQALAALQQTPTKRAAEPAKPVRGEYHGRKWVTRPRPGVDRGMSAWLIRTFIDPKARFVFAKEEEKPKDAVPFDMYEGGFGHRGEDCTFETLTKAFGIRDKRVKVMAEIVHDADLFDEKFGRKEGFGIDEVMKGWARQKVGDVALLERGMQLAEGLYQSLAK